MVAGKLYALVCSKETENEGEISSFNGIKPAHKLQYNQKHIQASYLNFSKKSV
jgi:hypothetical protein